MQRVVAQRQRVAKTRRKYAAPSVNCARRAPRVSARRARSRSVGQGCAATSSQTIASTDPLRAPASASAGSGASQHSGTDLRVSICTIRRGAASPGRATQNSLQFFTGPMVQAGPCCDLLRSILLNGVGGESCATPFFWTRPAGARIGAPAPTTYGKRPQRLMNENNRDFPPGAQPPSLPARLWQRARAAPRWGKILGILLAIVLLAWLLTPGKGARPPAGRFAANGPMPVVAAQARAGDMPITLIGLGTVTPIATVTVQSQISGQIMKIS